MLQNPIVLGWVEDVEGQPASALASVLFFECSTEYSFVPYLSKMS